MVCNSVRSKEGMGGHVPPSKNSRRPPGKKENLSLGGMPKRPPQC